MGRLGKFLNRSERYGNVPASGSSNSDHKEYEELAYQPRATMNLKEFCNSFWGEEGYEILLEKIKVSNKMLEELKNWYKERATIEADYSKKLQRLCKANLFQLIRCESEGLQIGLDKLREVTMKSAHSHAELSGTFKTRLEAKSTEFINKREGVRKNPQASIEKLHKRLGELKTVQEKARKKFELDAISVSGYSAQLHLVQGREMDKISSKLDKAQGSIGTTEKDYRALTRALEETTETWNLQWKSFCDLMQDLEEDRIDFVRSSLWDFANGISTVYVLEEEHAEDLRKAVERFSSTQDVIKFIQQAGTGRQIYAAPGFIDYSEGEHEDPNLIQHKYPRYELANFTRNTCRDGQVSSLGTASMIPALALAIKAGGQTSVPPPPPPPLDSNQSLEPAPTVYHAKHHLKRGGNIAEVVVSNSFPLSTSQAHCTQPATHRSVQLQVKPEVVQEDRRSIIYNPKHHDPFHGVGILVNNHHSHNPVPTYYPNDYQNQVNLPPQQHHPSSMFTRPLPPHPMTT